MRILNKMREAIKSTGLHRPVRQLVSASYRRQYALMEQLIKDIHLRGFERIRQKHSSSLDNSRKYLNLDWHLAEVVHLGSKLGLLDSSQQHILDLGCGSGCFLFTLKTVGHEVLGVDLSDTPLYNDMVQLLGIPRLVHRVEALRPLPDFGKPFDIITAFSICFDLHWTDTVWGVKEWMFFLDDCRSRLRPGGRIFLNFNPATQQEFDFVPDEVAEMLRQMPGGSLSDSKEYFTLIKS